MYICILVNKPPVMPLFCARLAPVWGLSTRLLRAFVARRHQVFEQHVSEYHPRRIQQPHIPRWQLAATLICSSPGRCTSGLAAGFATKAARGGRDVDIPQHAVNISFTTSTGPGGQNVNKVTRCHIASIKPYPKVLIIHGRES